MCCCWFFIYEIGVVGFFLWNICYCWFFIDEICVVVGFLFMKYMLLLIFYLWNMCYCRFFIYVSCVIVVFYLCACWRLKWQDGIVRNLLKCWAFFPLLPKLKPQLMCYCSFLLMCYFWFLFMWLFCWILSMCYVFYWILFMCYVFCWFLFMCYVLFLDFIDGIFVIVDFLLMKYVLLLVFYLWNMCYCWFFINEICVIVGFLLMCYVICVIVVFYLCACGKLKWQEGIVRSLLKCWTFFHFSRN